jgi:hypothetical protein
MFTAILVPGFAVASLFAGAVYVAATLADATAWAPQAAVQLTIKSDPIDARPSAAQCSRHAWPYYESSCLHERGQPIGHAREARVVSIDRLPVPMLAAHAAGDAHSPR